MSRLIVKNLPRTVTADKLKEQFSSKGIVTDIQLKYTQDGKFRHFAFIGFQTAEEANRAVEYFDNTFINQVKITVQHCAELGDVNKPKAWSKYAPDSSAFQKIHSDQQKKKRLKEETTKSKEDRQTKKEKIKKEKKIYPVIAEKLKKHKDDPLFLEFMEAHAKERTLGSEALKIIMEDSGVEEAASRCEEEGKEKKPSAFAAISDIEYMELKKKCSTKLEGNKEAEEKECKIKKEEAKNTNFFTVKITNLPFATKKRELKEFFRPLKPVGIRIPPKKSGFAYISFKTSKEMKKALNKNKSFLKCKQVGVKEYAGKEETDIQVTAVKNEKQRRWKEQEEALLKEENIAESGSIFVRNLAYTVLEEELTKLFESFGPLTNVAMPVDKETRRMKGFATVTFVLPEHALAAFTKLDGTVFHGRMLHLLPAKTKRPLEEEDENKTFKEKKKEKQKESAGQCHNWNTLFLGQNAVVDVMSDTYNISKQDVLSGSDVAVRLALAETQLVSDTKQFLQNSGVSLKVFNQPPKLRSKTVILVKNLPALTSATEMREVFCKFGELGRVVLPPSGVTAIVEFLEPSEAKKAFFSLAYTRFKHLPLYLEWAPDDTFSPDQKNKNGQPDEGKEDVGNDEGKEKEKIQEMDVDLEPEPETTLFVKNLNFDSTEESVKKHFSKCGHVASVSIARKRDPARPGQMLSMGYGFVQFYTQSKVTQVLKLMQNSELDGHKLELKRSNRTLQSDAGVSSKKNNVEKQTGTTILVRNIPFQATQKEVLQLFKTFGEIKAVRLPKKLVGSGSHRGFAFVEFYTKHDAKRAMQALCQSTHFFGRRLVLEWAQEDEDVDHLRKRTAQNFRQEPSSRSKKSRAQLEIEEDEDED